METRNAKAMELKVTMVDHPASHANDARDEESEDDTDGAASKGDHHGLDDKLTNDVRLACADGAAQADFACALENAGEHDVS